MVGVQLENVRTETGLAAAQDLDLHIYRISTLGSCADISKATILRSNARGGQRLAWLLFGSCLDDLLDPETRT